MKAMKVLSVILGVLLVIAGLGCLMSPGLTYLTLAWVIGFAMLVNAIGDICAYSNRFALGVADGWTLAGAIVSLILAFILLFSNVMQLAVSATIVFLAAGWMVVVGILRIVAACKIHAFRKTLPEESRGNIWLVTLIVGILMVIGGIIGFIHPIVLIVTIGFLMGLYILLSGVALITSSFT